MAVPVNTVAPSFTGTLRVGRLQTGAQGSWTNTPLSYAYQWQRAEVVYDDLGVPVTNDAETEIVTTEWEDIGGATSSTYTIGLHLQHMLRLRVIATNGDGASEPAYSAQRGPILSNSAAGQLGGALIGTVTGALGFVDDDEGD